MKALYEKLLAIGNVYSDKFPHALSLGLILFLLIFGAGSMYFLLNATG